MELLDVTQVDERGPKEIYDHRLVWIIHHLVVYKTVEIAISLPKSEDPLTYYLWPNLYAVSLTHHTCSSSSLRQIKCFVLSSGTSTKPAFSFINFALRFYLLTPVTIAVIRRLRRTRIDAFIRALPIPFPWNWWENRRKIVTIVWEE